MGTKSPQFDKKDQRTSVNATLYLIEISGKIWSDNKIIDNALLINVNSLIKTNCNTFILADS